MDKFKYFSKNGEVLSVQEASIPIASIEYSYGFGVYETLRVASGHVYFVKDHIERLMESARIIGLEHTYTPSAIEELIDQLIAKNEALLDSPGTSLAPGAAGILRKSSITCNIKMLLIGAPTKEGAQLYIICLNPLFPDRKLYRDGATFITKSYERAFPQAKTLNMLQSYLAYRDAKRAGAYDALLLNRQGNITEGTRTNFYCIKGQTIYTPPEKDILLGVTRKAVLKVAVENGYNIVEQDIKPSDISLYDGAFISSTSSKIIPVKMINDQILNPQPETLVKLMGLFNDFLDKFKGEL